MDEFLFSRAQKPRHYVIDHSVFLEQFITEVVSIILDVNLRKSKSLGNASSAISLSQKILMINDKIGVDSELSKKFEIFLRIRNKFAHIYLITNWYELFAREKNNDIKNKLNNWYSSKLKVTPKNEEHKYKLLFCHLTHELSQKIKKMGESKLQKRIKEINAIIIQKIGIEPELFEKYRKEAFTEASEVINSEIKAMKEKHHFER